MKRWAAILLLLAVGRVLFSPLGASSNFEENAKDWPQFKTELEQRAAALYREQDWPHFFAIVQMIRTREMHHSQESKAALLALEVMALQSHCQYEQARELVEAYEQQESWRPEYWERLKQLSLTRLSSPLEVAETSPLREFVKGRSLWPLSFEELPEEKWAHLRVFVADQCDE